MKFFLIVAKGKKQGLLIPIEVDLFLIGGGPVCQLRAAHDEVGEEHCALVMRGRKVFVSDLNSGLPTLVNGEPMEPGIEWPLHSGDSLEVGPLKFIVQYREKLLSQRDMEEWALSCLDQSSDRRKIFERGERSEFHSPEYETAATAAAAILEGLNAQKGVVKGRLRVSLEGGMTVVRINDVYLVEDSELAMIRRELHDNLNLHNMRVLIDMKNVKRMSSQAAEMFADLRTWLRPFGSKMAFCRLRPEFVGILHTYPSSHDLPMYADKQKALVAKW